MARKSKRWKPRFVYRTPGGIPGTGMVPAKTPLGRFIRRLRLNRGISQRSPVRMLGGRWTQSLLSQVERGRIQRLHEPDVRRLARVFAIHPDRIDRLIPPVPLLPPETPLAHLIRGRREALRLTRTELARRAGSDILHIGELERTAKGLRYEFAQRLAKALRLNLDVLSPFTRRVAATPGNALGAEVRRRRKALGLSSVALGRALGVSKASVLAVERGDNGLTKDNGMVERYARALHVDAAALSALRPLATVRRRAPSAGTFGGWLTKQRLLRHWSQQQLSARSGLGGPTICYLERNEAAPRPKSLRLLAQALGLEVSEVAARA